MLSFDSREYSYHNYRRGRLWNLPSIYNHNSRELSVKLRPRYTAPSSASHYHDRKYLSFVHAGWAN